MEVEVELMEVELGMEQASIFSVTVIDIVSGKNHGLPRLRYVTGNCDKTRHHRRALITS